MPALRFGSRSGSAAALMLVSLSGCGAMDPYGKSYAWHPSGANAANIAAQIADPRDLRYGHDDHLTDGAAQAVAITRIQTDHPKHLPVPNGISVGGNGSSGGSGGGSSGVSSSSD